MALKNGISRPSLKRTVSPPVPFAECLPMLTAILLLALPGQVEDDIEYESYVPPKYEVFVFMATKCPMANLYRDRLTKLADRYPQVHFQGVSVNENDTDE